MTDDAIVAWIEKRGINGWDDFVEIVDLSQTRAEVLGLLKGPGAEIAREAFRQKREVEVLKFLTQFVGVAFEVERGAAELLITLLANDPRRRWQAIHTDGQGVDWDKVFQLLAPNQFLHDPYKSRRDDLVRDLLDNSVGVWSVPRKKKLYELIVRIHQFELLLGDNVLPIAMAALEGFIFGSGLAIGIDSPLPLENPSEWTNRDLSIALGPGQPDAIRDAAKVLCILAVRHGLLVRAPTDDK